MIDVTVTQVAALLGLVIPPLVIWVSNSKIPVNAKYGIAVFVSALVGLVSTFVEGFTWATLVENFTVVIAASQAAYELYWRKALNA